MTWFEWLRARLLEAKGLLLDPPQKIHRFEDLWESEWSPSFEDAFLRFARCGDGRAWSEDQLRFIEAMRNRLVMGAFRYGLINAPGKRRYPRMAGAIKRLRQYKETGNLELLVDVANMALLEWAEGDSRAAPGPAPGPRPAPLDWVGGAEWFVASYLADGNRDHLPALASAALWEFTTPRHPGAHWAVVHGDHCVAHEIK